MYFIIEEVKETILDFSKGTVKNYDFNKKFVLMKFVLIKN